MKIDNVLELAETVRWTLNTGWLTRLTDGSRLWRRLYRRTLPGTVYTGSPGRGADYTIAHDPGAVYTGAPPALALFIPGHTVLVQSIYTGTHDPGAVYTVAPGTGAVYAGAPGPGAASTSAAGPGVVYTSPPCLGVVCTGPPGHGVVFTGAPGPSAVYTGAHCPGAVWVCVGCRGGTWRCGWGCRFNVGHECAFGAAGVAEEIINSGMLNLYPTSHIY